MRKSKKKALVTTDEKNAITVYIESSLTCDLCDYADNCKLCVDKKKDPNRKCALSNGIQIEKVKDLAPALLAVVQKELNRYIRSTMFEELDGGSLDKKVTLQAENIFKLAKVIKDLSTNQEVVTIKREGTQGNSPGKSILETLLGGGKKSGK